MKKAYDWTSQVKIYFEHTVEYNGSSYLLMFGEHINGGFIAIPNWGWCCEASSYVGGTYDNISRLKRLGVPEDVAVEIATYINEFLKNRE